MTWPNVLYKQADQRTLPQKFDILGIGISKHKTNSTGEVEWTGITRHARADLEAFAALADLLAHEIAIQTLKFIDMLQSDVADASCDQLWKSKVFFPNTDRTEHGQKGQITSLLSKVTKKIKAGTRTRRLDYFARQLHALLMVLEQILIESTDKWAGRLTLRADHML